MPIDCIESAIGVAAGSHGHTQVQVCDRVKITSSTKIALLGTSFRMMIQDMNLNYNMFLIYVIMLAAICLQLAWEGVALRDRPEVPRVSLDKNKSKS